MSSIATYLSLERIVVPMKARDSKAAVRELLATLEAKGIIAPDETCLESILRRERRMSTAVGKGVAFPHGLSDSVQDVVAVLGISPDGIDFRSVDSLLCHIFVLLISPASEPDKHHKLLSRLNKLLADGELRSHLLECTTPESVLQVLVESEEEDEDEDFD